MTHDHGPVRVLAHGSLMSAAGLGRHAAAIQQARVVHVPGSRRFFGKPPRGGSFLAMDVTLPDDRATFTARAVAPEDTASADGFEGLLLSVDAEVASAFAVREGYPAACWDRLAQAAGGPTRIARLLLDLAETADHDPLAYRHSLHRTGGFTTGDCWHYLPHPVEMADGPAVIFVAPAVGRTGDPDRDSSKRRLPANLEPGGVPTLHDVGRSAFGSAYQHDRQTTYATRVLLAAAHGVHVGDVWGGGRPAGCPVSTRVATWRTDRTPLQAERSALAHAVDADVDAALARSGLAPAAPLVD